MDITKPNSRERNEFSSFEITLLIPVHGLLDILEL